MQEHQDKCVIIDEILLMPRLFPLLRALIDQHRVPARFMILRLASPSLIRQSSETLAGRIAYTQLAPLSLTEINSVGISTRKALVFWRLPRCFTWCNGKCCYKMVE